jgi:AcrR family transcriptional regulator
MPTVTDPRVLRTREALREAMTALAAENSLDAITMRAIAARAGVSYPTVFRHYADKEALLADVADVLTQAFLVQLRPLMREKDRLGAARALVTFVQDRLPIYKALIAGGSGDTVRAGMLSQALETVGRARLGSDPRPLDDLLLFHLISTCLNLLAWWLRNLDHVDAETMAQVIERMVLTPLGSLRRAPPGDLAERHRPDVPNVF